MILIYGTSNEPQNYIGNYLGPGSTDAEGRAGGVDPHNHHYKYSPCMSYGLNLGWGGPIGEYIRFWGDLLRDILQILVQGSYIYIHIYIYTYNNRYIHSRTPH